METFDDYLHDLRRNPDSGGQFNLDCVQTFSDEAGQRLIASLVRFRNPSRSVYQGLLLPLDPLVLAFRSGQTDIINTLYFKSFPPSDSGGFNPYSVVKS